MPRTRDSEHDRLSFSWEDVKLLLAGCNGVVRGEGEFTADREGFGVYLAVDVADPDGA